ncbi:MAG: hypothetical protein ACKOCB_08755 [Planctomycetia bacterium]
MSEHPPLPPRPPTPPAPPSGPQAAHAHPGPAQDWKPLSGLCLAAFILALVLSLLCLVSLWAGTLLPLALGALALWRVDGTQQRGRGLAWWAVGLSATFGWLGYSSTRAFHEQVGGFTTQFVATLRSERPAEERQRAIEAWLASTSTQREVLERIDARYREAVERLGPLTGPVTLPSVWAGQLPFIVPPVGSVAVDAPSDATTLPGPGSVVWARLPFRAGEGHLALWIGDGSMTGLGESLQRLAEGKPVPVLRDARFFAPPSLLGVPATAPAVR